MKQLSRLSILLCTILFMAILFSIGDRIVLPPQVDEAAAGISVAQLRSGGEPSFTAIITPTQLVLTSAQTRQWELAIAPIGDAPLDVDVRPTTSDEALNVPVNFVNVSLPQTLQFSLVVRRSLPAGEYAINVEMVGDDGRIDLTLPISVPVAIEVPVNLSISAEPADLWLEPNETKRVEVGVLTDSFFRFPYSLTIESSTPALTGTLGTLSYMTSEFFWLDISQDAVLPSGLHSLTLTATMEHGTASTVVSVRAPEHVYLPNVQKDACGSPVVDNFDFNSGWPTGSNAFYSAKIQSGKYRFVFDQQRTVIVTRGDRWTWAGFLPEAGTQLVEIETMWEQGEGVTGIVWNINDSFTAFETFELIQPLGVWAHWQFSSAAGWELISFERVELNNAGNNTISLTPNPTSNVVTIRLNSESVTSSQFNEERIGLVATGREENAIVNFDRYIFVGPYCPMPNVRSAEMQTTVGGSDSAETHFFNTESRPDIETLIQQRTDQ